MYRNIIQLLCKLHHTAWLEYCDNIHSLTKLNIIPSPAKTTLPILVEKNKIEAVILLKRKKIFFSCTKLQYLKWINKELQRWFGTARKILQRCKLSLKYIEHTKATSTYSTIYDPNNNFPPKTIITIHTIYKAPQTYHTKASPIILHPAPQFFTVPNTNLATGFINKNAVTAITLPINTVVDQDRSNQHNNNHEQNLKNLTKICIP